MKYRKMTDDLDYTFGLKPGEQYYSSGEAVVQAIITRLNLLKEEWWEDLDEGLPLFQEILGKYGKKPEDINLIITERVMGTEGVSDVYEIEGSSDVHRHYAYSATVDTIYGDTFPFALAFDGLHFYQIQD